jgi:hypothetical protein
MAGQTVDALKSAYNGTFRGQVVAAPQGRGGLWVIVPRLNGGEPMGPCQRVGAAPAPGAAVLVATIAGVKDDLVVIGTLT